MKYSFLIFLLSISLLSLAQNMATDSFSIKEIKTENIVYNRVEKMPEYMGGEMALFKFIQQNLVYPNTQSDSITSGRVIVSFIVNKDGFLSDFSIKKGLSPPFNREAINVLKKLPRFSPGTQQGKPVRVAYILPIIFK